mmetsp:Transcript_7217/g.16398  ORF Transcript_7217/g.16398 Transcript_7217/m.16398 type:complete len:107 (+) Transcript_7217:117-437(+)
MKCCGNHRKAGAKGGKEEAEAEAVLSRQKKDDYLWRGKEGAGGQSRRSSDQRVADRAFVRRSFDHRVVSRANKAASAFRDSDTEGCRQRGTLKGRKMPSEGWLYSY